jgi:U5 small nuclear ribonucleoprotein component
MDLNLELNPDNFDEFGNYIGPDLEDDAEDDVPVARPAMRIPAFDEDEAEEEPAERSNGLQRMQIDGRQDRL